MCACVVMSPERGCGKKLGAIGVCASHCGVSARSAAIQLSRLISAQRGAMAFLGLPSRTRTHGTPVRPRDDDECDD